jgi:SSS family solute:Na+ symporter
LILPGRFGGYHNIFPRAAQHFAEQKSGSISLPSSEFSGYATLALGSALAAFMYPHTITSVLASSSAKTIRKNAVLLPAYTVLLGLVALLGIIGAAAGLHLHSSKDVVPALFALGFPRWFLGFAFAAISVAALVPASIMSIAAANLFTRNIYLEYCNRQASAQAQGAVAKYASLYVNVCALLVVLWMPMQYAINFQLIGGVLILQTLPGIVFGLWKRLFHHWALLAGWGGSLALAVVLLGRLGLQRATYRIAIHGHVCQLYVGVIALAANLLIAVVGTVVLDLLKVARATDGTQPADYIA